MKPVTIAEPAQTGDVLYHPAMGFAEVVDHDADNLWLTWEESSAENLPRRLSAEASRRGYRRCPRSGFFARSMLDRGALRATVKDTPVSALVAMLHDLAAPHSREELLEWLIGRELLDTEQSAAWWDDIQIDRDPRFVIAGGRLAVAEDTLDEEEASGDTPILDSPLTWSSAPRVEGLEFLELGHALLNTLARLHLSGRGVGLGADQIQLDRDGGLRIEPTDGGSPSTDLFVAGRLLIQRLMGRLPNLPAWRSLAYLGELSADIAPSTPRLLAELLTPHREQRPDSAIDVAPRWAAALALERIRQSPQHTLEPVHISWAADTHIGVGKMTSNQTNQDWFGVAETATGGIFVVCDGISISNAGTGDQASRLAVTSLLNTWSRRGSNALPKLDEARQTYTELLSAANRAVCDGALEAAGGDVTGRIPMGTTAVIAVIDGEWVDLLSLGDSRIHHIGMLGASPLTGDHNVALQWVTGERSAEEDGEQLGPALTGYLGHFEDATQPELRPFWWRRLRMLRGERLVLCSDGIIDFGATTHLGLLEAMEGMSDQSPSEMATALVQLANDGGGGDNSTALVIAVS